MHPNPTAINLSISDASGELPHLVFRRFPSPSDSLSASEISDSSLSDPSFLKSESSESSLPTDGNARGRHTRTHKKKWGIRLIHIRGGRWGPSTWSKRKASPNLFFWTSSLPSSSPCQQLSPLPTRLRSARVCDGAACGACRAS